jgi:signal transduction histidine kinase
MTAEKLLADAYKLNDDIHNYNQHLLNFYTIKDSISSVQNVRSLTYYQTLYETEKQGLKIEKQENNIAFLDAKNRQKNEWLLFGGLGLLSIFFLVTIQKSKNTEKKEKIQQEKFSQNLLLSQEEERIRIARELHDSVGQQLTLIKIRSQKLAQEEISVLTNKALEEVRSISRGLYPALLKELGLSRSIIQLVDEYDEQTKLFFTVDIDLIDLYFTESASLNFYRLIQECLTNIVKHAKAKSVTVSIKKEKESIITLIADNGKGFNVEDSKKQNTLGLKTIFERIKILEGKLSIDSQINTGTNFILTIPVKNES